jgi:hypothetical protein
MHLCIAASSTQPQVEAIAYIVVSHRCRDARILLQALCNPQHVLSLICLLP